MKALVGLSGGTVKAGISAATLPPLLRSLIIGHLYNNALSGTLPESIKDLSANKRLENRPYVVTEISDVEVVVDDGEFSLDVSENFGDINDNINRYNASGLPKGLTINSSSGEISGTPTTDGIFGVTVTVSDTAGGSVEDEFEIEVLFRDDHLHGGTGNDHIYGGSGNDYLYGYTGSDHIYGGAGNDYLYGYTGSDYLYGGTGNDYLYGGTGKDIFVLTPGSGLNVIMDYTQVRIRFDFYRFTHTTRWECYY